MFGQRLTAASSRFVRIGLLVGVVLVAAAMVSAPVAADEDDSGAEGNPPCNEYEDVLCLGEQRHSGVTGDGGSDDGGSEVGGPTDVTDCSGSPRSPFCGAQAPSATNLIDCGPTGCRPLEGGDGPLF